MRIMVHSSGVALPRSRQLKIEQKARTLLARFERRLADVRVRLRDINGPRGGVDKEALVVATLDGEPSVQVECQAASGKVAVHRALKRLASTLQRRVARRNSMRRRGPQRWFAKVSLKDRPFG